MSISHESSTNTDNVVAFLRHELRTPINAIIGYGEILQEDLEEEAPLCLSTLNELIEEGNAILELINQLLRPSKETEDQGFELHHLTTIIPLSMNPCVDKILNGTHYLLGVFHDSPSKTDIEKIHSAALTLQGLVNNISAIIPTALESSLTDPLSTVNFDLTGQEQTTLGVAAETPLNLTGHILVIDDNSSNLDLLSRQLLRRGHRVTTGLSAKIALEKLALEAYDLILLDWMMPEMRGDQLLKYLKESPQYQHIPVIMISALDEIDNVIRCIEMGAEDFLPKPCDPVLLKARIDSSLERKRLRDQEQRYVQQLETLSQMMQQELDKGRQMQKNFLPAQLLNTVGWEFGAFFSPARQLAGDFYDLFELPGNCVGLVIADVCDKGVGAALFMGLFRSLLRIFSGPWPGQVDTQGRENKNEVSSNTWNPDPILAAIRLANDYVSVHHGDTGMFATIFFGIIALDSGQMSYINGGHEPVFILDREHHIRHRLRSTGPAVGMLPGMTFKIEQVVLEAGDFLVAYTDGVPEAKSTTGQFFGKDRLQAVVQRPCPSAQAMVEQITQLLLEHISTAEQFDDITLVVAQRLTET